MGDNITGSEFQALVVVVHEALLVAVEQVSALATDSLGNKEALTGSPVVESSRVELNIAEVLDLSAHFVGECDAVAGSDSGICGELINSADTAGSKYHEMAVAGLVGVIRQFSGKRSSR